MATSRDFYSRIAPYAQGCPTVILDMAINQAIAKFCERSTIWRTQLAPIPVVKDQNTYTLLAPSTDAVLSMVLYVSCSNAKLLPVSEDDLMQFNSEWRSQTAQTPMMYYTDLDNDLVVHPIPQDATTFLEVSAAWKPSVNAVTYPDWLLQDWADVIAHGALSYIHAAPGKVWSDTSTVSFHNKLFRDGITRAKSKVMRSHQRMTKEVKARPFW